MDFPKLQRDYFGVKCDQGIAKPFMITIHQTQGATARGAASYLQSRSDGSAHYVLDDKEGFKCADDDHILCGVAGQNTGNIHIELAGFSSWPLATWLLPDHRRMVQFAAWLVAKKCNDHGIKPIFKTENLPLNRNLINYVTTHRALSLKYKTSTHTDPGVFFPAGYFQKLVTYYYKNPNVRHPVSRRTMRGK